MIEREALLRGAAEELFENAPCGFLTTTMDGTIVRVNRTFEAWTGRQRADLVDRRRFSELLNAGGRIYYETHYAPLLRMQGAVSEIAVDIVKADGSTLPALVNSVVHRDAAGEPQFVMTTVFDATDRRRYERELMTAHRREHEIALKLQRSMLTGELPRDARMDIGVAYHPAVTGLEIGGDWYDAFPLADGDTVAVVVGDVVGRGIGAAATMGQLRSAVRALTSTGLGPAELLDALEIYVRRHGTGQMATVVCCHLHLVSGQVRYACAGHPPPVIIDPGEEPRFDWDGRSPPLDATDIPSPRAEAVHVLQPGGTVLLYTDGLIERRSTGLDHGMSRLLEECERHRDASADEIASNVVTALQDPERSDDVCVLAARLRT